MYIKKCIYIYTHVYTFVHDSEYRWDETLRNHEFAGFLNHKQYQISIPLWRRPLNQYHPKRKMKKTRWWFRIFFDFTSIWRNYPIWLILFEWVVQPPPRETSSKCSILGFQPLVFGLFYWVLLILQFLLQSFRYLKFSVSAWKDAIWRRNESSNPSASKGQYVYTWS